MFIIAAWRTPAAAEAQCHVPATHYPASLLPGGPALEHPQSKNPGGFGGVGHGEVKSGFISFLLDE